MSEKWNHLKARLEFFLTPFPADAVQFADQHRDELAPFLVEVLARVAADPSTAAHDDYVLHQYAMHLLATWRDTRAYAPLLAWGRLDDPTLDTVLGDALTESYGRNLAAVCGGDVAPLKALIEDAEVSVWVREAAVTALVVRVLEGDDERLPLVQYLVDMGEQETARISALDGLSEGAGLIESLARAAGNLVAVEMRALVERWFDEGLIDLLWYSRDKFNADLSRTFEEAQAYALGKGSGYVIDVEAEIGGWSGFTEALRPRLPEKAGGATLYDSADRPQCNSSPPAPIETFVRDTPKVGRNDPCPCGSGKKYKKCCSAA